MIHNPATVGRREELAASALSCDLVLTQPLFNHGPCNTSALREALPASSRLFVFSSPNFEAYFPDACIFAGKSNLRFQPVLDWDSSIIFYTLA